MIGVALALPLTAQARAQEPLTHVKTLAWTGRVQVQAGNRTLEIAVRTRVEPFLSARSESWLVEQGPASARTMIVGPAGGFVERGGQRTPLPPTQTEHERQQFGLYGYLVDVQGPVRVDGEVRPAYRTGYPPILFRLGANGVPHRAEYKVDGPEGGKMDQRISFTGRHEHRGIVWPGGFAIRIDDKPYFTLTIETFTVELA